MTEAGSQDTDYQTSVDYIASKITQKPQVLIICGSGLGTLSETIKNTTEVQYQDIPNFPKCTIEGHGGKLIFGELSGKNVMLMMGRFHFYEGYTLKEVTFPVRVAYLLGCKYLLVTNAAGSVNSNYKVGDVMVIKDHVNLFYFAGNHPCIGPNDKRFGQRFYPMNRAYDRFLTKKALEIGQSIGLGGHIHSGVYVMIGGPTYETVAEMVALKTLGADAVGMSTIPEVCVAKHCGMSVVGFSVITDEGIFDYDTEKETSHEEVLEAVNARSGQLQELVRKLVSFIPDVSDEKACVCKK